MVCAIGERMGLALFGFLGEEGFLFRGFPGHLGGTRRSNAD